jgi:hypothetical protein
MVTVMTERFPRLFVDGEIDKQATEIQFEDDGGESFLLVYYPAWPPEKPTFNDGIWECTIVCTNGIEIAIKAEYVEYNWHFSRGSVVQWIVKLKILESLVSNYDDPKWQAALEKVKPLPLE